MTAPQVLDLFSRRKLTLIAGPCVIESYAQTRELALALIEVTQSHSLGLIFKASFDKANRTSLTAYRGPGLAAGLEILAKIKAETGLPILTDVHLPEQVESAAKVVDVLQIPAFLCRQTDLIVEAARSGLPTNIKKGQFVAAEDMRHAVKKHQASGGGLVSVTERGFAFGYHDLVVDMRSLVTLRQSCQTAVVFDATHSVQQPGGKGDATGGNREMIPVLARAAAAVGVDGLFCEVHADPDKALSDGPNSLTPQDLSKMLAEVIPIDALRRQKI